MLALLSPAKKQDFTQHNINHTFSLPKNQADTKKLVNALKKYKPADLEKLMSVSNNIAELNYNRYQNFVTSHVDLENAKQAIFAFQGDVYKGLAVQSLSKKDVDFMQQHLLILSGLYGYLRPLDLIQPYRLEMKTKLKTKNCNTLYEFWGDKITLGINEALKNQKNKLIINLASNEYFKAINTKLLTGKMIHIDFKENDKGTYKTIGIHAKRARGMMMRYITTQRIIKPDQLMTFEEDRYRFVKKLSCDNRYVFVR